MSRVSRGLVIAGIAGDCHRSVSDASWCVPDYGPDMHAVHLYDRAHKFAAYVKRTGITDVYTNANGVIECITNSQPDTHAHRAK